MITKEEIQERWKETVTRVMEGTGIVPRMDVMKLTWLGRDSECFDGEWKLFFSYEGEEFVLEYSEGTYEVYGWEKSDVAHLVRFLQAYPGDLLQELYNWRHTVQPQMVWEEMQQLSSWVVEGVERNGDRALITYYNSSTKERICMGQSLIRAEILRKG